MVKYIHYSIELHSGYSYTNIAPNEILEAAQILGYKGIALNKLIKHNGKLPIRLKTKGLIIYKHFSEQPTQYISFDEQHKKNIMVFYLLNNIE